MSKKIRRLQLIPRYHAAARYFRPLSQDQAYFEANRIPEPPAAPGEYYISVTVQDVAEPDRQTVLQLSLDDARKLALQLAGLI
jgi:hypothetical protein